MEPTNPINEFVTNDLSLAAYMLMCGASMVKAKRLGKSYKFILDLGEMSSEQLMVSWVNSECSKFDSRVRDLKKALFSSEKRTCSRSQTSKS